ncbi:putative membrane protein [Kibdelosporangium banguiense]|uniref:Membrane protein n=1 Tax=Kibdelosporangium banguiense TaxID=1365924 RepID=A0ABS4TKM7_9PSEU|nr:sulfatase [Kibdelosporangium banguiense]MBP2324560.1 putative membrane protein [Kibdelosporangium banguiense]
MTTDGRFLSDAPGEPRAWRRVAASVTTALAGLLLLFALVAPNQLNDLSVWAFVRIPIEGLLGVAIVLMLPPRPRQIAVMLAGTVLGVLTVLKIIDMGFFSTLNRPFDPVFDWSFFGPAIDFLSNSIGRTGAVAAGIGAAILALGLIMLVPLSAMRLTKLVVAHRMAATRTITVLTVIWVISAAFSLPIASKSAASLAYAHAVQANASLKDSDAFAKETAVDQFRDTPPDQLLTALRGKDVVISFVESYGRVAVEDPVISPPIDALLDAGTSKLQAAGFGAKSAFLTSSTSGGGSWLAHATLQSGLYVNNQKRYNTFTSGDRLTLSSAFRSAGWRTVGIVPQNDQPWPEGDIYNYSKYYEKHNVGYKGKNFFYAAMPDQYTLSAFQRNERSAPDRQPVMAEIDLVSSHTPFVPLPQLIDWNAVGDGSVFGPMADKGQKPEEVWNDAGKTRTAYGESIQYSLSTLISYVQTYGDDNLVLVVLGDHQPAPVVTGDGAGRDVPITIIAKDPTVLDKISGWRWHDGLNPGPQAPVWPMNSFRDQFMTAFGSQPAHPHR